MSHKLPRWISPVVRDQIVTLRRLYAAGETSKEVVRDTLRLDDRKFRTLLRRVTGQTKWPVEVSDEFLLVPVKGSYFRPVSNAGDRGGRIPMEDIAARVERDQARLRAERDRWLDEEQSKYGLARRHLSIDEMPV